MRAAAPLRRSDPRDLCHVCGDPTGAVRPVETCHLRKKGVMTTGRLDTFFGVMGTGGFVSL